MNGVAKGVVVSIGVHARTLDE